MPTVQVAPIEGQTALGETTADGRTPPASGKNEAPKPQSEPEPEPTSAQDRATARALASSGMSKLQGGDPAGALEDFQAADAIVKVPTIRLLVGKTQQQLGMNAEAKRTLESVLKMPSRLHEPAVFQHARDEAKSLLQTLGPWPLTGRP